MVALYWRVGKLIVERQRAKGWGPAVIERLSRDVRQEFQDMQGFSPRNIWRMRAFYLAYTEEVRNLPQAAADFDGENMPWIAACLGCTMLRNIRDVHKILTFGKVEGFIDCVE